MRVPLLTTGTKADSNVCFAPIADVRPATDKCSMRVGPILDQRSRHAPTEVSVTLFAALLFEWFDAPADLPRGLAIIVGSLAFIVGCERSTASQLQAGPRFRQ